MFNLRSKTAASVATPVTTESPANDLATGEVVAIENGQPAETTTSKKRNRKAAKQSLESAATVEAAKAVIAAKAAAKAAPAPTVSEAIAVIVAAATDTPKWSDYHDTTQTAPVADPAPDLPETAALIWNIPSTTAPAKKAAKKAATGTAAARKAALAAEGDKAGRLERVIALLVRPEGASLQDIQSCTGWRPPPFGGSWRRPDTRLPRAEIAALTATMLAKSKLVTGTTASGRLFCNRDNNLRLSR
jgi:hypothetical protein